MIRSVILLWIFFSLLAISFVGDQPLVAIVIAMIGGIVIGVIVFQAYRRG